MPRFTLNRHSYQPGDASRYFTMQDNKTGQRSRTTRDLALLERVCAECNEDPARFSYYTPYVVGQTPPWSS